MEISLVDNGLDSLSKGYKLLKGYEALAAQGESDKNRFLQLKDAILSIQHGIEILFKYILKKENELFIYKDITVLGPAFVARRQSQISELWQQPKVHTITFKESIERLIQMCGIVFEPRFEKRLRQVEAWRNSIIHSAVILNEQQVSSELKNLIGNLDEFLGRLMGDEYIKAQGKVDLERSYRLASITNSGPTNEIKRRALESLIATLKENHVEVMGAPSAFKIDDPTQAYAILRSMQESGVKYGCDLVNSHCSGKASINGLDENGELTISTGDNGSSYQFKLSSIVVYLPELKSDFSPLIYLYADKLTAHSSDPFLISDSDYEVQRGLRSPEGEYVWDRDLVENFWERWLESDEVQPSKEDIYRFLTPGLVCFMNVMELEFGGAHKLLYDKTFSDPTVFYDSILLSLESK